MKRNELKKVLKPLIKECIKEVIFEEGVLSGLISEVLKGTSGTQLVSEAAPKKTAKPKVDFVKKQDAREDKINKVRKTLTEAIGKDAYGGVDIFEGVQPISKAGAPGPAAPSSPLQTYAPGDAGVDISAIFNPNWKNLV